MTKSFLYKIIRVFIVTVVLISCIPMKTKASNRLQTFSGETPVVVIDAGHGGDNQGTIENNHEEKSMTIITALSIYNELLKFDDVTVYLTRNEDVELSLKERAEIAESYGADFLFSVHYNASVNHDLFGAEIWIPYEPNFNQYGYQFGYEFLSAMKENGIFIRGIKTKLGSKGLDYYGIIRECQKLSIPAVILEHCHVDHPRDEVFCDSQEELVAFGVMDAHAIARYLGLKSNQLGVDYSEITLQNVTENHHVSTTHQDETPPDICEIEVLSEEVEKGTVQLQVTAADYDSVLLYYDYSIDGGETYSELFPWPDSDALSQTYTDTFTLTLNIPSGMCPVITVRAYNLFDACTISNEYHSNYLFSYGDDFLETQEQTISDISPEEYVEVYVDHVIQEEESNGEEVSFLTFIQLCLIIAIFILVVFFISQCFFYYKRHKKRSKRK